MTSYFVIHFHLAVNSRPRDSYINTYPYHPKSQIQIKYFGFL